LQLAEACLSRIEIYQPKLNAFITVLKESAFKQAREVDAELRAGKSRGTLHGIPIALKDDIDTAGIRTTAATPSSTTVSLPKTPKLPDASKQPVQSFSAS